MDTDYAAPGGAYGSRIYLLQPAHKNIK